MPRLYTPSTSGGMSVTSSGGVPDRNALVGSGVGARAATRVRHAATALGAALVILAAGAARAGGGPGSAFEAAGAAGGPADTIRVIKPGMGKAVFASEDSSLYEIPVIDVEAVRVPLIEIIRKAQEGERRKYAGLKTMAYNLTLKTTMVYGGKSPKTRCQETVQRVYYREPHDLVSVTLRDTTYEVGPDGARRPWNEKDKDTIRVTAKGERNLTELPFYLERLDKFRFSILTSTLRWPQVLYEVRFEPMSDFENLPGGRLWLLTPEYQVVREEFVLKNLPFPWVVKKVDLLTREWQPVNGRWVEKRITGRVDLGLNFLNIPKQVEFVALFDRYEFDPPLDPAIFEGGAR